MPNKTILIIEDEALLREMYATKFAKSGYSVKTSDGRDRILDLVKAVKPSVVLTDLLMPAISGYDILDFLKSDPQTKNIPVIIISNLSDNVTVQKSIWKGATDVLLKAEVSPESIVERVNDVLAGKTTAQALDPHVVELFEHEERSK